MAGMMWELHGTAELKSSSPALKIAALSIKPVFSSLPDGSMFPNSVPFEGGRVERKITTMEYYIYIYMQRCKDICEYIHLYDFDCTHTRVLRKQDLLGLQNNIFFLRVILRKFWLRFKKTSISLKQTGNTVKSILSDANWHSYLNSVIGRHNNCCCLPILKHFCYTKPSMGCSSPFFK